MQTLLTSDHGRCLRVTGRLLCAGRRIVAVCRVAALKLRTIAGSRRIVLPIGRGTLLAVVRGLRLLRRRLIVRIRPTRGMSRVTVAGILRARVLRLCARR
jgi:hypothetical protein